MIGRERWGGGGGLRGSGLGRRRRGRVGGSIRGLFTDSLGSGVRPGGSEGLRWCLGWGRRPLGPLRVKRPVDPRGGDRPTLGRRKPSPQKKTKKEGSKQTHPKKRGVQKKGPQKRGQKKDPKRGVKKRDPKRGVKKGTQKRSPKKGTQKERAKKNSKAFSNFGSAFACPPNRNVEGSRRSKRRTGNTFITSPTHNRKLSDRKII